MYNYVVSNNKYESLTFMVCCDDEVREKGNITRADSMKQSCKENNWQHIYPWEMIRKLYMDMK